MRFALSTARRTLTATTVLAALVLSLVSPGGAAGADPASAAFARGDVFASVGRSTVERHGADTAPLQLLTAAGRPRWTNGMAFRRDTNELYVAANHTVFVFDASGSFTGTFGGGHVSHPGGIVFDPDGNAYVPLAGGSRQVLKLDPQGQLVQAFTPEGEGSVGPARVDLAPDGCTLLYTTYGTTIKRFDVCRDLQLPDLVTDLPGFVAAEVRALADGGALVANYTSVLRIGETGQIVATYDLPERNCWIGLAMDLSWTRFWAGDLCTGSVHRFSVASGASDLSFDVAAGGGTVAGLAVLGGVAAAFDAEESGQTSEAYIPPEGGEVTSDTGPGATPEDPAYGRAVFPAGPGGFAAIVEEAESITPCTISECVGIAIDYIVPPGYLDPEDPIRLFLVYDASLLDDDRDSDELTIWVEKPVAGLPFFSIVPECGGLIGPGAVTGCVADQTEDPVTGDVETEIWMLSDDPMYQG